MEHLKIYTRTMFKIIIIFALIMFCFALRSHADINIDKIIQIESSGNPRAYNRNSKARGLMQVTPICLKEHNRSHKQKHSIDDLFNGQINVKIGTWYINKRIPQMLKHYRLPDTIENRLIAYNWGIGNLIEYRKGLEKLPTETKNYIVKYKKGE